MTKQLLTKHFSHNISFQHQNRCNVACRETDRPCLQTGTTYRWWTIHRATWNGWHEILVCI